MSEFQFIHAADLHLGAPFRGLHQNPNIAAAEKATYAAFDQIIQLAITRKVLFVLFSGDIFDAEYPNLWAQLQFQKGIQRLDEAGIYSCVIRGNHDHGGSRRAQLEFPATYFEFPSGGNEPYFIDQDNIPIAAIYGYSYPQRAVTENVLRHFKPGAPEEKYFRIGMLHGNVGGDPAHDNYAPCSVAQLKEIAIDYWALGHVHQAKVLSADAPAIVYPGTPQGLSARETGAHGCYLVNVKDRHCQLEFIPTDSLRWANVSCDITKIESEEALLQTLEEKLNALRQQEQRALIARLEITGRGPLHGVLRNPQTRNVMREELNGRLESVWIDRLQNATRPDLDLETKRQENNLLGDFLRLCQEAKTNQELRQKVLLSLADACDHPTVREALDIRGAAEYQQWLDAQLPGWLEQAETHGADLLVEDSREI